MQERRNGSTAKAGVIIVWKRYIYINRVLSLLLSAQLHKLFVLLEKLDEHYWSILGMWVGMWL